MRKEQWARLMLLLMASVAVGLRVSAGTATNGGLEASGVMQAEQVRVASELQGYVAQVFVQTGDVVKSGQVLLILRSEAVESSVAQARAALETARADLAVVRSRPRAEEVAATRARVAVAQAEQNKAYAAYQAALEAASQPQALLQRIVEAEGQLALATAQTEVVQAQAAKARYEADQTEWNTTLRRVLDLEAEAKRCELEAARADESAARVALLHLRGMESTPLLYFAAVHAAAGEYGVAEATTAVQRAYLLDLMAGATEEEVAVAEAGLALAEARLRLAQAVQDLLTLRSPVDGTVIMRTTSAGETALPGMTLLTVADLSEVHLTVYVSQARLGEVFLDQGVDVVVDGFAERRFAGRVVHIADQPQYTPRNVATREERVNTVYAVKIRLANPEGLLKPGMAAEVVFRPQLEPLR